jgi:UDP-N-acetylglucosamine transferase subunit ALG13
LTKLDKRFILVPRQHCLGEHLDDHQMELAEALSLLGFSIAHSPGDIARFLFSDPSYPMIDFAAIIKDNLCRDLIARFPPNQ